MLFQIQTTMKKLFVMLFVAASVGLMAQAAPADSNAKGKGLFSVGPQRQVRFSPGNLQYQPTTHLWRFAPQQNQVQGWEPYFANGRYKGWIDLFGWGTALSPENYSESASDYSFVDWGTFCGLPTDGGLRWRTMSLDEWTYLLSKRPHARRLYALAYVEGKYGLILLPDNWKSPKGVYLKTGPKEDYVNVCNEEKWAKLEAAGAIFLPSEVKRLGTESQGGASICHYWMTSSNSKKTGESLYLLVDSYLPQVKSASRANGFSVRLVQDVETAEPEQ